MIDGLKPYPVYKPFGMPWLDQVPEHWEMLPNRALMRRRKVLVGKRHSEYKLLSLTKEGVIVRDLDSGKGKFSADMGTCQEVRSGDLVFCLFDVPETPRTVGLSRHDGMITGAYTVFECDEPIHSAFLDLFYRAMDDRKLLGPLYSGLRNTIPPTCLLGIKTPVPPLPEQSAIIRFLDHADRRIRRYIRAKQKLIKLLVEQKQVIIHRALTCGPDSNVPVKPSGVGWLGDVPEHWKVLRVKQCARTISKGTTPSTEGREILESGQVRFLKAENIAGGRIVDKPLCFIDEETHGVLRRSQLREDDVLFVIAGATLGKTAVIGQEVLPANTNQAVAFVRPNKRIVPNYLALWFQSPHVRELTWLNAVQSAQPNLSMSDLGSFPVPVPPVPEQHDILLWLNSAMLGPNKAVERAQREIGLLREYQTRLVADVVTGKLDVGEAAANLPDEAEEPDRLDDTETLAEGDDEAAETDLEAATEEAEA